jgi:Predicted permease, DMT superfamily
MTESQSSLTRASALIVASSLGFGSLSTLTVLAAHAGLPLINAMFWRYLIAVSVLIVFLRKKTLSVNRTRALRLMLVGAIGQALITYLSLKALDYLPVGPLGFLFYTYPAWVAITSAVTGHESLTRSRVSALLIAMIGIAVMVGAPARESLNPMGVALALGTAFLYALYLPSLHKAQAGIRADVATLYLLIGVLASFAVSTILTGEGKFPVSLDQWKYVLLLSLVCTVGAFSTLISGLRILGPVRTSIVSTVEPFFTAVLGVVFLSQPLSGSTFAGGALVALAVVILQLAGGAKESDAAMI